jgi:two-component system cell cycle response regulator DivK
MAVTAYAGRDDEERIRAAGANAYVSKPIGLVRFMEEVRALMPAESPAPEPAPAPEAPEAGTEEAPQPKGPGLLF